MSASTVIGDVTLTLEELLKSDQRVKFDVTHNSPAQEASSQTTTSRVNLYLFRVVEDPHTKNQEWLPVAGDILRKPPLILDLYYVLTPFAQDELDEQRILGEAMRILYDHATIEGALLKGGLADTDEELFVDLNPFSLEELVRIWNASNQAYRLSVCYQVRTVAIDSSIEESTRRVLEKENQHRQKEKQPQ